VCREVMMLSVCIIYVYTVSKCVCICVYASMFKCKSHFLVNSVRFRHMACFELLLKYGHFGDKAKNVYLKTYILNVGQWRHFSDILAFWTLHLSSILHLLE